ncbi:MAG: hypothetical protein IKA72_00850 [Clostridia bacterium]|nr:hypothetical protein [Clostridia bacterium]
MRKNKSKKTKVPVLDEKGYAEYLDYLKREEDQTTRAEPKGQGQVCIDDPQTDGKLI